MQTLDLEVSLIWPTRWGSIKVLYFLNRLLPFLILPTPIYYNLAPKPTDLRYFLSHVVRELLNNTLHPDISKDEVGTAVCVVLSEGIMYMRVYALSSKEPLVTSFILVNVLTVFVAPVALLVRYAAHGEWVRFKYPELGVGCAVKRPSKHNIAVMVSYAVLLYSGLGHVYYGLRVYWTKRSPLIRVFYRDGTFYFIALAVMSIANGVAALIVPSRYRFLMAPTLSIRMVLHLRDEARRQMGLDTLDKLVSECICLHDQPYSAGHPDSNGSAEVESV
ncbi:hypothetical protein CC2G_005145 [Coprinopsis cinerea AmutBmut pab1-1]|nr:hypothetical protein CC2G_005145 [Coprinopsis cinerea AmutBmut pab1-1]